ncbi:MAG: nucleotidyltransferase family protein [Acidobacteriota bacterium]|nr:nucleotidyltransferase family protein [Acidobacteriota bacterium]
MSDAPFSVLARALSGAAGWESLNERDALALHDAAVDHGLDALVWAGIAAAGAAPELRALLEPRVRAAATRDLFVQRDLQSVVAGLDAAGIPALLTKGTALAYTVYPQPWLRPRIDTDLLVRHDDVPAASAALERCGYSRSDALSSGELVSHQIAFERIDAHDVHHVLDLHWKIVNPQIVADALTFDELWRSAQPAPALGPTARVPSTVGSIALACVHRLAHHYGQDRSIWLYDLKLLVERLTPEGWTVLQQLACEQKIAGFCLDGLRATRSRFGTGLPQAFEGALAAAAPGEPSRAYVEGPVSKRDGLMTDLAALPSWRDRARLLREHAFPPAAFMQQRYGTNARWLLPALYVHRIATGGSKWVRP